ncbi:Pyrophosphate--fructose 6-phosphate 1-phosphotransferase subunit beta 2 [Forsythia ovata]|uniref:Pyrophosphate--fructose 6-phosphate 1-phosphotransferase subunit beta 2 n=1 Tax=Forsythia ovata TaxID=205694 RepID=A0ABD1SQ73_9LAMI
MSFSGATPGRLASEYSEVQSSRLKVSLPLPSVLKTAFKLVDGPPSSAAGNPDEIAKLFPNLFGQPSAALLLGDSSAAASNQSLKIGVVLSGGQAPGGHNGGFDMICSGRDKIETPEQFKQAEETAKKLDLDGLVVIGGDDSNTNACLLAEDFR